MGKELIKKYLRGNKFLMGLVVRWRRNKSAKFWRGIIQNDSAEWTQALSNAARGEKVLIATSVGSHLAGTTIESMLSVALIQNGAEPHVFLCDAALPACLACTYMTYPDFKKFSKEGPSSDCKSCYSSAKRMYESIGVKVHSYGDYLSADELGEISGIAESVPVSEIPGFMFEGLAVGEHAKAGALRFFARGELWGEPFSEPILRRYFKAALLTAYATRNLIKVEKFKVAVFHHGIYIPQGIIGEVCRQKQLRVVNWNPAYRQGCFVFSHEDTYHRTMITEPVSKWEMIAWDDRKEKRLTEYLKSRWDGSQDWIWFQYERPTFEVDKIYSQLGISKDKPVIGLLTSVMWDAVLHYKANAFPDMLVWVRDTIAYFAERQDLQLLIRVHPAEIRGALPSRQRLVEEILAVYPVLPQNIIIIPPESDISTYAAMSICDSVIIYNTKTGVELSAAGKPVIVAGEAWIRGKGFTVDVETRGEYSKILDSLPLRRMLSGNELERAKKYAYHFFFRRMIPLEFMKKSAGQPPYRLEIASFKDLAPGKSKGLSVICAGILSGTDFICDE